MPTSASGAPRAEVEVKDNPAEHRFEALVDGHLAVAVYTLKPGEITFEHTIVPAALQGRGIGTRLVEAGLAAARERGLAVVPRCPMFAAYMRRHPETQAQLSPAGRAVLGV